MTNAKNSSYFSEETSVAAVNARVAQGTDPRLTEVMAALVKHLHAFTKEVGVTQDEWDMAIDFFTRTGQKCDEHRQEFILLSDIVGLSMLVDAINNRRPQGATENTVLGPFHIDGVPHYEMGANITLQGGTSDTCTFHGTVTDTAGNPLEGVMIDVFSDNEGGFYDVQQPDIQPLFNNRGIFHTGADGKYWFTGVKPLTYGIPDDGPVGQLLRHMGRHPNRPAHMHFVITADGFEKIVTHTFVEGDEYIGSDAVFGVKESLIAPFVPNETGDTDWISEYNFVMVRTTA